jgi:hypothetical protein
MQPEKLDENDPLAKYYIAVDKGTKWHMLCKQCDEAWAVPKDGLDKVGNMLFLLNHARSHDKEESRE